MSDQNGVGRGGGGHGGGGGGHHGGGGFRGGGGGRFQRHSGGGFRRGGGWGDAPWPYDVVEELPSVGTCPWGEPVPMTANLAAVGQQAFEEGGTYPAFGYADGVLFRFSINGGALVAQPCAGPGVMGDPPPLPTSSGPQPMGMSIKSIDTPDYLKTDVRALY